MFVMRKVNAMLIFMILMPFMSLAEGGISIKGTRIIYPQNSKQENVYVGNSSSTDSFLVQSWVENENGEKVQDFVVTPPLYLSGPKNENVLRLVKVKDSLPTDRETLYYFIVKAIPSINKNDSLDKGILRVSAATKIKLFSRPSGLKEKASNAPSELNFKKKANVLEINNPTPYFITISEISSGGVSLSSTMVRPKDKQSIELPAISSNTVSFKTIDDSGAITKSFVKTIK